MIASDLSAFVLLAMLWAAWLLGALTGSWWGMKTYRNRLRDAAARAPRDQVALATLERVVDDDRYHRRREQL